MGLLDKLMFWRKDDSATFEVEGCFTLPDAEPTDSGGPVETTTGDAECVVQPVEDEAGTSAEETAGSEH